MGKIKSEHKFRYDQSTIKVLANALEKAFNKVGCDLRCFDWLSYNPDFHRDHFIKKIM